MSCHFFCLPCRHLHCSQVLTFCSALSTPFPNCTSFHIFLLKIKLKSGRCLQPHPRVLNSLTNPTLLSTNDPVFSPVPWPQTYFLPSLTIIFLFPLMLSSCYSCASLDTAPCAAFVQAFPCMGRAFIPHNLQKCRSPSVSSAPPPWPQHCFFLHFSGTCY